jgi:hypothetical protein
MHVEMVPAHHHCAASLTMISTLFLTAVGWCGEQVDIYSSQGSAPAANPMANQQQRLQMIQQQQVH